MSIPGRWSRTSATVEVRAAAPGEVRSLARREGAAVSAGEPLADLAPDKNHVWEALRALVLVGTPDDQEAVERFTRPIAGMPETVSAPGVAHVAGNPGPRRSAVRSVPWRRACSSEAMKPFIAKLTLGILLMAGPALFAQTAGQDMKRAGEKVKDAGEATGSAAKDVGSATAKTAKKTGKKVKHGYQEGRQQGRRRDRRCGWRK